MPDQKTWINHVIERDIELCNTRTGDDWRRTEYPDYEPQEKIYHAVMLQNTMLARLLDHFKVGTGDV